MSISKTDCPQVTAAPYPGAKSRNNPSGSLLSRNEYIEQSVQNWINHFEDSEKYQNSSLSLKGLYLVNHLNLIGVNIKLAKRLLCTIESKQDKTNESDKSEMERMDTGETDTEEGERMDDVDKEKDGDADMFSDEEDASIQLSRVKSDLEITKVLEKSDRELFEEDFDVSAKVARSKRYIERRLNYTENYLNEKLDNASSQDILLSYSQNPNVVQESKAMRSRLSHLSKEEKANKTVLKSVNDTIAALQKTPGQKAKDQEKIILASVTHHRWGPPSLPDTSWRTRKVARKMKQDLLDGTTSVLEPPAKKRKMMFPIEVEELAVKHWKDNTVIEPALHSRRAVSADKETVPTRYQSLTDNEQYSLFKEECSEQVEEIMRKYAVEQSVKVVKRPESEDKAKRLNYYATLHEKFPGFDWYLDLRPSEVKPLHDHTTALCRRCESTLLNYTTLVKEVKNQCKCSSSQCPNWICMCATDSDEEEFGQSRCSCKCECDDCMHCKVCTVLFYNQSSNITIR